MSEIGGSGRKAAYADYLKSDHWRNLKKQKSLVEPRVCAACSDEKSVQLHHMLYREIFEDTRLEDTCWLCRGCHRTFHLRAGVKIKTRNTVAWIREETIRIITTEVPKRKNQKLTKRERRRIANAMRREAKRLRKVEEEKRRLKREEQIRAGKRKEKGPKSPQEILRQQFNIAVNTIKPRSALNSTMVGQVVVINPRNGFSEAQTKGAASATPSGTMGITSGNEAVS